MQIFEFVFFKKAIKQICLNEIFLFSNGKNVTTKSSVYVVY